MWNRKGGAGWIRSRTQRRGSCLEDGAVWRSSPGSWDLSWRDEAQAQRVRKDRALSAVGGRAKALGWEQAGPSNLRNTGSTAGFGGRCHDLNFFPRVWTGLAAKLRTKGQRGSSGKRLLRNLSKKWWRLPLQWWQLRPQEEIDQWAIVSRTF